MQASTLRRIKRCVLCGSLDPRTLPVSGNYLHCQLCDVRFLAPEDRLPLHEENERYRQHNNDVNDPAYRRFFQPLVDELVPHLRVRGQGLDFGAGSGPLLARMLEELGFTMALYDPTFWPDRAPLDRHYDFVVATEVAEHLFQPLGELARLARMLKPGGWLAIMTLLVEPEVDFANWFYRRDPTHVVFYSRQSFIWLAAQLGFKTPIFSGQRIVLLQRQEC